IESAHGTHSGGSLGADGYPDPPIRGIALDGSASAAIADTDGGVLDGDAVWDRAVGPLQFIPATWQRWGADANGDGAADPNQIDDAALGAARYLCAAGEMTSPAGWRRGVLVQPPRQLRRRRRGDGERLRGARRGLRAPRARLSRR
ncbi:lytic murein transglycosylase, partial [Microbacterium sp. HMWF026]|uniref:lytic murein transglycosylase n=1 Tax=Microbacterium sp. HMWF026 TaxID=2056861 RepID=UPI002159CB86